jgi:hypothetical protein
VISSSADLGPFSDLKIHLTVARWLKHRVGPDDRENIESFLRDLQSGNASAKGTRLSEDSWLFYAGNHVVQIKTIDPQSAIVTRISPAATSLSRPAAVFDSSIPPAAVSEASSSIPVERLISSLRDLYPSGPLEMQVTGTFCAATRLSVPWWERRASPRVNSGSPVSTQRPLQMLLQSGFENWGLSLDLNGSINRDAYLIGQLGHADEADSLPLIIGPKKGFQLRAEMRSRLVVSVAVVGMLLHHSELTPRLLKHSPDLNVWASAIEDRYFMLVEDDEPGQQVQLRVSGAPEMYSAYLWQCLIRKDDADRVAQGMLTSDEMWFIFEHTNLAEPDTVQFCLDSLKHKRTYLEKHLGTSLILLLSSHDVHKFVEDEPLATLLSDPVEFVRIAQRGRHRPVTGSSTSET